MTDILTMTVAQAIAWLTTFGIAAAVTYVLSQIKLDEKLKSSIQFVVVAMLVAGVTALANLLPPTWLDMRLFDAAIALVTFFVNAAGLWFGKLKGEQHLVLRLHARLQLKTLA